MAKRGKEVTESKVILTKRDLDFYRNENGHLKDLALYDISVDGYTLKGLSVDGTTFKNVAFSKILAQGVDFTKANIINCTFADSDFRWSKLTKDQRESNGFENCNFRESDVVS